MSTPPRTMDLSASPRLAQDDMNIPDMNIPDMSIADAEAFVFDVDGTLVLSDDPNAGRGGMSVLPGAIDVLHRLRERGTRFVCFTNGSGQVPGALATRLRGAGLDIADDEMLTPPVIAVEYIRREHPDQTVLAFGNAGVLEPLRAASIPIASLQEAHRAGVVLIGADPNFTYDKLEAACRAVWAGAPLLVTSMAQFFASRGGRMPSTSGAIAAGITHVTGVQPLVVGKPSALVLEVIATLFGITQKRLAIVGDDLDLEIRMATDCGAYSALVLTGTTHESELARVESGHRPSVVLSTIADLLPYL
jgi:HAD superfamily hydrolase (TIGR01450 family)